METVKLFNEALLFFYNYFKFLEYFSGQNSRYDYT